MNPALSTSGLARIREFVGGRSLLAFDIDGTLAPIVARPWDAHIPDELQVRLAALTATRTVAIITGRAIADAKPMLGFSPRYLIGNHGAEGVPGFESASATYARDCSKWLEELRGDNEAWRATPGITLEDNAYLYLKGGGPVAIVYPEDGTSAIADGMALCKRAPNPTAGKAFIDWSLSAPVQEMVVQELGRRPIRKDAKPLGALKPMAEIKLVKYDIQNAANKRQEYIDKWRALMLAR